MESKTVECDICGEEGCRSRICRGRMIEDFEYKSIYLGKDLDKALIRLFHQSGGDSVIK